MLSSSHLGYMYKYLPPAWCRTSCAGSSASPALAGDTLVTEAVPRPPPGPRLDTNSDRQAGHVVHNYHLVTSNSDWENFKLKHPEAAADGQLSSGCRAALITHEGVPRGVTLYPASLGATMTRIHQLEVTSVNYI